MSLIYICWYQGQGPLSKSNMKVTFKKKNGRLGGTSVSQTQFVCFVFQCTDKLERDRLVLFLNKLIMHRVSCVCDRFFYRTYFHLLNFWLHDICQV